MPQQRTPRVATLVLAVGTLALAALLALTWHRLHELALSVDALERQVASLERSNLVRTQEAARAVSSLPIEYKLELPGRGEIFPALAATQAPDYWPVAILRLKNTAAQTVSQTVTAQIPGWSRKTEQTVALAPGETRQVRIQPELLPRAYENDEIRRATLEVRAAGPGASILFAQSRPLLIHGGSEIYWGRRFGNAQLAARWVTPHEASVLQLVSEARRYAPRGRLAGYDVSRGARVEQQVREQARAVFRALQRFGLSYVNSLSVMGEHVDEAQRIRLPRETLQLASANCMDLSVLFASAMENLGMQPVLVILPGHAFVGVRTARASEDVLYLDLTVLPNGNFDSALARAQRFLKETPREEVLTVDVAATRALGVYPLVEVQPQAVTAAARPPRAAGTGPRAATKVATQLEGAPRGNAAD